MIAFVHIEKTAGTTLYHILRRSFGRDHCDIRLWPKQTKTEREENFKIVSAEDIRKTKKSIYWNLKSIGGHYVTAYGNLHEELEDLRYYTFLREPLKRCSSHFQFFKKHKENTETFEEWIERPHYRNVICNKIAGVQNAERTIEIIKNRFTFIGIQEHFDESLLLFREWARPLNLDIHYQSRNIASHSNIKDDLLRDPTKRKLLEDANEEDQKVYEWVIKTQWPRQIRESGLDMESEVANFREENSIYEQPREPLSGQLTRDLLYKPFLRFVSHGMYTDLQK